MARSPKVGRRKGFGSAGDEHEGQARRAFRDAEDSANQSRGEARRGDCARALRIFRVASKTYGVGLAHQFSANEREELKQRREHAHMAIDDAESALKRCLR